MSITNIQLKNDIYNRIKLSKMKDEYEEKKKVEEETILPGGYTLDSIKQDLPSEPDEAEERKEVTYSYLDQEELYQEYGLGMKPEVTYRHNLCIYRLNTDLNIPFLEFALVFQEGAYQFPTFEVALPKFDVSVPEEVELGALAATAGLVPAATAGLVPAATPGPTQEPIEEPVPSPTQEPIEEPVPSPAQEPIEEPVPSPAQEPIEEPVPSPAQEPIEEPVPTPTQEPIEEPVPSPAQEPVPSPTKEPVPTPTQEPIEEPVPSPTQEPVPSATQEPVNAATPGPTQEPVTTSEPVVTSAPVNEPVPETKNKPWFFFGGSDVDDFADHVKSAYRTFMDDTNDVNYRGFVETPIQTNTWITAVVQCTDLEKTNHTWVSLDEIINKKDMNGVAIHETVSTLFQKNPFLKHIRERTTQGLGPCAPVPITMYMCSTNDAGDLHNAYYAENETNVYSLLPDTTDHPFFGDVYLFTTFSLDTSKKAGLKRFSVFVDDALYIMNKGENITQYMTKDTTIGANEEDNSQKKTMEDYSAIRFYTDDSEQVWAVRATDIFTEL
jgi:hypothetical protein